MSYRLMVFSILSFYSCVGVHSEKQNDNHSPQKESDTHKERLDFLSIKSVVEKQGFDPQQYGVHFSCFGGPCLTNLNERSIPRTPYLNDYNAFSSGNVPRLMVFLPMAFLANVPQEILESLKEHGVSKSNVTMCWNVQDSETFGADEADLSGKTTRLKAHGWASPDAPRDDELKGDLVNRTFLLAIYEPDDPAIATADVKIGTLLPFPVNTHQTAKGRAPISPPNMAKIAITRETPSLSFWSLVIDDKHPADAPLRAGITLHWILHREFIPYIRYGGGIRGEFYRMKTSKKWNERPVELKEVLHEFKNNPTMSNHKMVESVRKLFADVWDDV